MFLICSPPGSGIKASVPGYLSGFGKRCKLPASQRKTGDVFMVDELL